jgi:hypothetical protein
MNIQFRTLTLGLLLVSGAAHAGWFSHKAKPAPPPPPAPVVAPIPPPPPPPPTPLEFSGIQTAEPVPVGLDRIYSASSEVQAVQQWVATSKDNAGLPFIVVDKANARVYAFTPYAQLKATAPILLGMGVGDEALVSQDAPMSAIPPQKRITPAGRYPSRLVTDTHGKTVLLVDAANLITLHIVAKGTPAQRRAERLASVTTEDNRVSFGCINVPPLFFTSVVDPDFRASKGLVYVLPEKTTAGQLFGFQPAVTAPLQLQAPGPAAVQSQVAATQAQATLVATEAQTTAVATQTQSPVVAAQAQATAVAAEAPGPTVAPATTEASAPVPAPVAN